MQLSYDELRRLYRLEKNTSNLVSVEEDFYHALHAFVQKEKDAYLNSLKKGFSESTARNFANLKRIVEELCSLREKKILNKALVASKTEEINESNMALQEKELFQGTLKLLGKYNSVVANVFDGVAIEKQSTKSKKDLKTLSLNVLVDVPVFIGADMKEYGPFEKEQTISLPFQVARLFVERKLGEIIEE